MQIKYFRFQCLLLVKKRCKVHQNVVEACVKANVRQIVYSSIISDSDPLNLSIENIDHSFTEVIIQIYYLYNIFISYLFHVLDNINLYLRNVIELVQYH